MINNSKRDKSAPKPSRKHFTEINAFNKLLTKLDSNPPAHESQTNDDFQTNLQQCIREIQHTLPTDGTACLQPQLPFSTPAINDYSSSEIIEKNDSATLTKINIQHVVNNVGDLLHIIDTYPPNSQIEYNIDVHALHRIREPLTQLNDMIGMVSLKENVVGQILFYIQKLHNLDDKTNTGNNDYLHTVIYGPPGTGKTEVAKILGAIFAKLGVLTKGTFKKATRADLIAGYLGQTALKTRDIIKECIGGVLFIDEAYALGNSDKQDIFAKECIDTLCEALSDNKNQLMVIINGYEDDLNRCFFSYNQGLESRFVWRYNIDKYNTSELVSIFEKKVKDAKWSLECSTPELITCFNANRHLMAFYGRDIETLFGKTKISHARRVFCLDAASKRQLTLADLNDGLKTFKSHKPRVQDVPFGLYS